MTPLFSLSSVFYCTQPASVSGYDIRKETLYAPTFGVEVTCAQGYAGGATATVCASAGSYTLSGCTQCKAGTAAAAGSSECTACKADQTFAAADGAAVCEKVTALVAHAETTVAGTPTTDRVTQCKAGYRGDAAENPSECQDIDECVGDHGCEKECVNTVGSFICECPGGALNEDGKTCDGAHLNLASAGNDSEDGGLHVAVMVALMLVIAILFLLLLCGLIRCCDGRNKSQGDNCSDGSNGQAPDTVAMGTGTACDTGVEIGVVPSTKDKQALAFDSDV